MKIISVVGARPNFMKIAPFIRAIEQHNQTCANEEKSYIEHLLVHTGQHYDVRMSESFFQALGIPAPDINLEIGSGSHAEQVGNTMITFEKVLTQEKPDWIVVVGDVNATLACSVTAKKLSIKVCHIEAGLRSGDETMPEEINRLVTDRLSDLLLTPDKLSMENLRKEGVPEEKIRFVGNIMIDTLERNRSQSAALDINRIIQSNRLTDALPHNDKEETPATSLLESGSNPYAILTMHRPSNVDKKEILAPILNFLTEEVAADMPVIWPIHPRTQKMLQQFDLWDKATACKNLILLHPIGYHEMLRLNMSATIMLTDSGGLQEECCVLGTPCLTLRWNTERPVTLKEHGGASVLVGNNINRIREEYQTALRAGRIPQRPELWDGNTANRCVEAIVNYPG
ncbi:non-hydrolyzing UDP-N-acetylglucosamine 2-epimerase [Prolixibacter denitrificans]|uniref:UDP-N-acetylglucosamine 2-epimerase (Non-hydrolysing) n=1 Tax=Prolixibacter denitrificans TaxID=1541063 RepID=A0A2P8CCB9_9BACT|nr:UDP-N-acetylglucosamine 2-epimerase (non-hydrolyzing) [Prolixibacter denitrificans]PSK82611.1 UDP-N-acetylglucosamine 2-epimerase (non-hydrolysing) [Prolixibacter denitrificans]GET21563.1 UDP-N-acetylglucosamine 2-epimerase (non-hydrolyzing) [Prolixibacter denitrificans]